MPPGTGAAKPAQPPPRWGNPFPTYFADLGDDAFQANMAQQIFQWWELLLMLELTLLSTFLHTATSRLRLEGKI